MELLLAFVVAAVALAIAFFATSDHARSRGVLFAILIASLTLSLALFFPREAPALPRERPLARTDSPYVSSSACLGCHPSEHASFGRTFHRTMTQDANAKTVLAPLDYRAIAVENRAIRLSRRGEEAWATLPDPDLVARDASAFATAPEVTRQIVLTTGSHREQTYWVKGKRDGELRVVPVVWLVEHAILIPRHDAFLTPPDAPLPPARWNSNCIACHAVAGEPGHDVTRDAFDTRAAELGIACEACHGPGRAHVEKHRAPLERYMQHAATSRGEADPTIVQPERISPEKSAAICGQCHSYAVPKNEDEFWEHGYAKTFRAGDFLEPSRTILFHDDALDNEIDAPMDSLFWPDGSIRVGGREYNGLVRSPCYEHGDGKTKMTCVSCHSMHDADPNKQIAREKAGDAMCTQCHSDAKSNQHGHHQAGSSGNACVSCHMPKTSYALFRAARSHRITSPRANVDTPNACNLCHLDRTLAWTSTWLEKWYGRKSDSITDERARIAEGLFLSLTGDAAVRVIVADALGSQEAMSAAQTRGVEATWIGELQKDPYAAVRFLANRSARANAPVDHARFPSLSKDLAESFLLDENGTLDQTLFRALLARRDLRAITIAE